MKGETEHSKINFTNPIGIVDDLPTIDPLQKFDLTSTVINKLKSIQLPDGSFDLNLDLANLLSINMTDFDRLKNYLIKQGLNSFGKRFNITDSSNSHPLALNIQNEILRLIATGIILMKLFFQIPKDERGTYLVPFDHQSIRVKQSIYLSHRICFFSLSRQSSNDIYHEFYRKISIEPSISTNKNVHVVVSIVIN